MASPGCLPDGCLQRYPYLDASCRPPCLGGAYDASAPIPVFLYKVDLIQIGSRYWFNKYMKTGIAQIERNVSPFVTVKGVAN